MEHEALEKECGKDVFPSKWRCKGIFVGWYKWFKKEETDDSKGEM